MEIGRRDWAGGVAERCVAAKIVLPALGARTLYTTAMCTPIFAVPTLTQYWVHVRGSPWWPAKIVDPESIPESVRKVCPKGDGFACFKFYGENAYSWARLTDQQEVLPLEYDSPKAKKNIKMLQKALVMARRDGGVVPVFSTMG